MKLIIVIPAKNEEKTIGEVIRTIPREIFGVNEKEIVVINDGSTDQTARIARDAEAQVVSHMENRGVGATFATGIKEALARNADLVLTIDADEQFEPAEIPKLIQPILENKADLVVGSRFIKGQSAPHMPKIKIWGNKLMAKFVGWIVQKPLSDVSCGFRAYSREAMLHLNLFGKFTYTQETILNLCFKDLRITEVPVSVKYFPGRKSDVSGSLFNYVFRAMQIICRTIIDYRPLKFFGGLGSICFLIGVVFDIIMLDIFIKTGNFSPHIIIGVTGLVLNAFGLILIIIGFTADMLNRIRESQERALYFQKKKFYSK